MDIAKLPPADQLDFLLKAMRDVPWQPEITNEQLHEAVIKPGNTWELQYLILAMNKLRKDGMVHADPCHKNGHRYWHYAVTFDGEALLNWDGGYSGKLKSQKEKELREKRESFYLKLIALGATVAALGILAIEIWKNFLKPEVPSVYVSFLFDLGAFVEPFLGVSV